MKKYIVCIIMLLVLNWSSCIKGRAETKGIIELDYSRHQSRIKHVWEYTNKRVSSKNGNILLIETGDTNISQGRQAILRTEIADNSFLDKIDVDTKVDFYGGPGFIYKTFSCKDTITLLVEGGITLSENTKKGKKIYGNVVYNNGTRKTISIELKKQLVTFQELDLKVRKVLYEQNIWYQDKDHVKGKYGIHYNDNREEKVDLSMYYNYDDNRLIDVSKIIDLHFYLDKS